MAIDYTQEISKEENGMKIHIYKKKNTNKETYINVYEKKHGRLGVIGRLGGMVRLGGWVDWREWLHSAL